MMLAHCRLNSGAGDTPSSEHFRAYTASGVLVILHSDASHVVSDVKWQRIFQRLHPVAIGLHVTSPERWPCRAHERQLYTFILAWHNRHCANCWQLTQLRGQ